MTLRPDIAALVAKHSPDINLKAIDAALEQMNVTGSLASVAGQISRNYVAMMTARDRLPFSLAELFTNPNPKKWDAKMRKTFNLILNQISGCSVSR